MIDLDRVLIQNPFLFGVYPDIRSRLRPLVRPEIIGDADPDRWLMKQIYTKHGQRLLAADWVAASDWDSIVNEVATELGYDERIDVTALVRHYARPPYIAAYQDVAAALEWLRENVRSLWWISNGFARYQIPVMEALRLQRYFDGYFAPDTHGDIKPHAHIFEAAIDAAQQDRTHGVMVGDSLTADVAGARLNGMLGVWLDRALNPVFDGISPWDIPKMEFFPQYLVSNAHKEFQADAYGLDIPNDCMPHAVIRSLDQLPEVLTYFTTNLISKVG